MAYTTLKEYSLSDGTTITRDELAEQAGLSLRNASCRLQRTNDREQLFKPVRDNRSPRNNPKKYLLDDGQSLTLREMMEITGCRYATQVSRVYKHKDKADIILRVALPTGTSLADLRLKEELHAERMIGDSSGFWKLFNKILRH